MKPFRKNLAIAIDGGGIRGVVVTRALSLLEEKLERPLHDTARLYAGTSTGSIISAALAAGLSASRIHSLYLELGETVFRRSWRTALFPVSRYRYPQAPLESVLHDQLGDLKLKDLWADLQLTDLVITTFDVLKNKTLFIKPWKLQYQDWLLSHAVLASSCVPTYFPPVDGRYVDGGVGAYANPCYLAAYELNFCLGWKLEETTLISLGTGRDPDFIKPGQAGRLHAWNWLEPILDAFIGSASDQQVRLVETFFKKLDFRRFQVDLQELLPWDDATCIPELLEYGTLMGNMILNDDLDRALRIRPTTPRLETRLTRAAP
ncbi:MAG: patatin-like phospholipase family protein [Anaerolineales bacterium]